jgi:hypothetical protein
VKIRNDYLAPPGGWRFHEERTNFWGKGVTFGTVVGSVANHRINMKLPIVTPPFETLVDEIEDWICQHLSDADRAVHCEVPTKKNFSTQPGDMFSNVLKVITGRYAVTCGRCMNRMGEMNRWGWWGCWKNRETIIGWLLEEAAGRGHKVSREHVFSLLVAAFREIRRSRKRTLA